MPLYAANLSELAVPVKKSKDPKPLSKAAETKKRKLEEKEAEDTQAAKAAEEAAKLAKKELAKQKREAKKNQKAVEAVQEAPEESVGESETVAAEVPEPPAKKSKPSPKPTQTDVMDDVPPKWFNAYVEGVKKEEAKLSKVKKPRRVIIAESKAAAGAAWNEGLTRDRVTTEVNDHMNRMYSQIFGSRRMK